MASFKWTVDPVELSTAPGRGRPSTPEAAQSASTPQEARAEGVREIERLIAQGAKVAAIHKAAEVYGIDLRKAKSVVPTSGAAEYADTDRSGRVLINDDAFRSAPWLGATLAHEIEGHVTQAHEGRWYNSMVGERLNEVEAYDQVIARAGHFGLSDGDLKELQDRRRDHYEALPDEYQRQVDKGDYRLPPGLDDKLPRRRYE